MNFTSGFSASLPGPEWLKAVRAQAADNIERLVMPTTAEELWRYSRVDEIDLENLMLPQPVAGSSAASTQAMALREALGVRSALVVTINGSIASMEVDPNLQVRSANEVVDERSIETSVDSLARLNAAFGPEPIFIDIPKGAVIEKPIIVIHRVEGEDIGVFPRLVVNVGEAAQATVLEYFISTESPAFVDSVTELTLQQGSNLKYVAVQDLALTVRHIALQRSSVERDASLDSTAIAIGGDYARVRTDSRLVGAGASSKLRAVYVGSENQMHDFRTLQDHRAPKTTSDLLFKGVVGDNSRSVYSGLIRVEKGAAGTSAFQTNRNLVLSPGAHADSVPNLEIEENDVKCSHASAVGPVDEDQLYYLESRGVPTDVAEGLIVRGFLAEIIDAIAIAGLSSLVGKSVGAKLDTLHAKVLDR